MTRKRLALAGILLAALASAAGAADLGGTAQLALTSTDNRGLQSDLFEQQYTLSLDQELTPYLSLRFGYQLFDLSSHFGEGLDYTRSSRQPLLELFYNRRNVSGRVTLYQQSIENTLQQQDLTRRSLGANFNWRSTRWPSVTVNWREDKNTADVSVFGRDVSSRLLELTTFYNRAGWAASYTFERIALENRSNALQTDQSRHEVRASASRAFWTDRLSLSASGRASRLGRTTTTGDGTEIAEPIPPAAGLVAVDLSPEIGELDPNPTLIDGDVQTPASPPIQIGGANTFRNVGVDVGITRPVSQLEIAVDNVSGPGLVWQVYHSRDNLIWEPIPGVSSVFDVALLRYRLRFPQTEDRFFKAVNVSINPEPVVLVTEIRALLDLDAEAGRDESESNLYRADLIAAFRPARRVSGAVGVGFSNDDVFSAGLVRRDYSERHAFGRLTFDLAPSLDLHLNYRYDDSEDLREPVLLRTVTLYGASLDWVPLPTVDAVLVASRREESEKGTLLQSLQTVRLGVVTQLLTDLRLVTDLDYSQIDDPFAGRDRDSWSWRETLEMRPLPSWTLSGGLVWSYNQTRVGDPLLKRTQYRLWTTWSATRYLTLGGTLWATNDGGRSSLNQTFNVSYTPGTKLAISATYQGYDGSRGQNTSTDSLGVTYRLFTRFILFANLSRSRAEEGEGEGEISQISSVRAGLRLGF